MSHSRLIRRGPAFVALCAVLTAAQSRCNSGAPGESSPQVSGAKPVEVRNGDVSPAAHEVARARTQLVISEPAPFAPPSVDKATQTAFMNGSARTAWRYVSREMTKAGFVGATRNYQFLTVWDMGSALAAAYSARELGLIDRKSYKRLVGRALSTMERMPLYDDVAFNRMYSAVSGAMVNSKAEPTTTGMGFSTLDHGRLLIWLKLVGDDDPAFAPRARKIVSRLNMSRLVRGGYLLGEEILANRGEHRAYQEGRVGYEQYAAEGFALWGAKVDSALDFSYNGKPVNVYGQTLVTDARGGDVMTSEPFVMMGLELGWRNRTWRNLALAVLAAQEARYKETGLVTMVSEDAIPVPPAYFYYYLLYHDGKPFVVTTVSGVANDSFPRWVSAKAAFGYHALSPSDYTWRALQTVKYAGAQDGWSAGVFEGTQNPTKTYNLNTAAVVLESAAYMKRGCAFARRTCTSR